MMLEVLYNERFLKDLKKIKKEKIYLKIEELCFEKLSNYNSISTIPGLSKIQGYKNYYRIRIGSYRIGLKKTNNKIILMRVLDRKEIYKHFP
jgi:mRNA interferase RelE/StbE